MVNDIFIKFIQKERKVYEKHGGSYLWGEEQDNEAPQMMNQVLDEYEEAKYKSTPEKEQSDEPR